MHFGVLRKESWPTHKEQKIMNINDRLDNMSKGELISLIKEIKITCESNRNKAKNTFNFILRLIKGYHYEDKRLTKGEI